MPSRWPALMLDTPVSGLARQPHRHDALDITGRFGDLVVGNLRSFNWDGGSDLSKGKDSTATQGWFFDAIAGALQATTLYWELGRAVAKPPAASLTMETSTPGVGVFYGPTATVAGLSFTTPAAGREAGATREPTAEGMLLSTPQGEAYGSPFVRSSSSGEATLSAGLDWQVTAPSTIRAGDTLLVFLSQSRNATLTPCAGWTLVVTQTSGTKATLGCFSYEAAGTEAGETMTPCTPSASDGEARFACFSVEGADPSVSPVEGERARGNVELDGLPDPPSLTPTGGAADYLWFVACAYSTPTGFSGYPTNYTGNQVDESYLAVASRGLNAATDNPGRFTPTWFWLDHRWVTATVVVYPGP